MTNLHWLSVPPAPPARPTDGHKGTFGTVIVIGGSATMRGAPALCATAAFRAGAGLVKLWTDEQTVAAALTIEPGATWIPAPVHPSLVAATLHQVDAGAQAVLAVGPGWGQTAGRTEMLRQLLSDSRPLVLDADGLNVLAQGGHGAARRSNWVLTPHPGEFRRLAQTYAITGDPTCAEERPACAAQLARATGAVVLLKGAGTIISDGQQAYRNTTGNPALAVGGSGDVLTGLIAGLLAQGMDALPAACLAAHLHGHAADLWAEQFGPRGMTARDLLNQFPAAWPR